LAADCPTDERKERKQKEQKNCSNQADCGNTFSSQGRTFRWCILGAVVNQTPILLPNRFDWAERRKLRSGAIFGIVNYTMPTK